MRIDTRAGSGELIPLLRAEGCEVEAATLPAGDVEIAGNGPDWPWAVGVEYKKLPDLLACMRNGRFAEQLRAMRQRFDVSWLLVELGEVRVGDEGFLEFRERGGWKARGKYTAHELVGWLLTMVQQGGALLWATLDQEGSVKWLRWLELWWTAKEYAEHRAHLDWYTPPYVPDNPFDNEPVGVVQKVAAALLSKANGVDVGMKAARAAAGHFGSVREMLEAGVKQWAEVEGVGKVTAKRVVETLK